MQARTSRLLAFCILAACADDPKNTTEAASITSVSSTGAGTDSTGTGTTTTSVTTSGGESESASGSSSGTSTGPTTGLSTGDTSTTGDTNSTGVKPGCTSINTLGHLYELDRATGQASLIGPIETGQSCSNLGAPWTGSECCLPIPG